MIPNTPAAVGEAASGNACTSCLLIFNLYAWRANVVWPLDISYRNLTFLLYMSLWMIHAFCSQIVLLHQKNEIAFTLQIGDFLRSSSYPVQDLVASVSCRELNEALNPLELMLLVVKLHRLDFVILSSYPEYLQSIVMV